MGIYFSSGDDGDEVANVGYRTVDWPASSPWVTAVGGTSLARGRHQRLPLRDGLGHHESDAHRRRVDARAARRLPLRLRRRHQQAVRAARHGSWAWCRRASPTTSPAHPCAPCPTSPWTAIPTPACLRPDADLLGRRVSYDTYRIGGTSLSSPLFAGIMALADQRAGHAHGFADPALYAALRRGAFRDVVRPPRAPWRSVRRDFVNGEDATDGVSYSAAHVQPDGHAAHPARLRRRDRRGLAHRPRLPDGARQVTGAARRRGEGEPHGDPPSPRFS